MGEDEMELRESLLYWAEETFRTEREQPWAEYPHYTVLRRPDNRKWFAVLMRVTRQQLHLDGEGELDILNVKCDPVLIGGLRQREGFFPAWHMSKTHWISVALDGTVAEEELHELLFMSHALAAGKARDRSPKS